MIRPAITILLALSLYCSASPVRAADEKSLEKALTLVKDRLENLKAPEAAIEAMKKRIHNDVSMIKDTVDAANRLYRTGGKIPPFGRPEESRQNGSRLHSQR